MHNIFKNFYIIITLDGDLKSKWIEALFVFFTLQFLIGCNF